MKWSLTLRHRRGESSPAIAFHQPVLENVPQASQDHEARAQLPPSDAVTLAAVVGRRLQPTQPDSEDSISSIKTPEESAIAEIHNANSVTSPLGTIQTFNARRDRANSLIRATSQRAARKVALAFVQPTDSKERYRYSPLPTETSIRLLQINEWRSPNEIFCSMIIRDVKDHPHYDCLSYTWGNPLAKCHGREAYTELDEEPDWRSRTHHIVCDGGYLPITRSLRDALWGLTQSPAKNKLFRIWIDAVCIDQDNVLERSKQVLFMHDIYRLAQSVIVWLGPQTRSLYLAIQAMEALSSVSEDQFASMQDYTFTQQFPYGLLAIPLIKSEAWEACMEFFARSWFGRAWIFQEAVLARQIQVICGRSELPWAMIAHMSSFLTASGWGSWISLNRNREPNAVYSAIYIAKSRTAGHRGSRDPRTEGFLSLYQTCDLILHHGRLLFQASDPRDMVYAALGCSYRQIQEYVSPNYAKSIAEVYTECSWAILRCIPNLWLMSAVEDASIRKTEHIPSWVPDFSVPLIPTPLHTLLEDSATKYRASGTWTRIIHIPQSIDLALTISGAQFKCIVDVGETYENLLTAKAQYTSLDRLIPKLRYPERTGESNIEALWRTLIGDNLQGQFPARAQASTLFRMWISWQVAYLLHVDGGSANTMLDLVLPSGYQGEMIAQKKLHRRATENTLKMFDVLKREDITDILPPPEEIRDCEPKVSAFLRDPTVTFPDHSRARIYQLQMSKVLRGRRVIRAEDGYLGLAPRSTQPGDEIWIFPGSFVPLVLRKVDLSRRQYRLVGEAYVHGIMRGEALSKDAQGWDEVVLV